MSETKRVTIRQVKSAIGAKPVHREILRGLGLRGIRHQVEREDTPAVRAMVAQAAHLVELVEE
jgi:large subunit ribosomal protein L30